MTKDEIANRLLHHELEWIQLNDTRPAAVMIPIIPRGDDYWDVVLEVRAQGITQGGEVCLPGGHLEDGETSLDAAIRETCEELCVDASQIEVLAPMVAVNGPSGRVVESYIAVLKDYEGTFSPTEVDHILTVPIRYFYAAEPIMGNIDLVAQLHDDFPTHLLDETKRPWFRPIPRSFYFYPAKDHVIWGMTANILKRTAEILYGDEH